MRDDRRPERTTAEEGEADHTHGTARDTCPSKPSREERAAEQAKPGHAFLELNSKVMAA